MFFLHRLAEAAEGPEGVERRDDGLVADGRLDGGREFREHFVEALAFDFVQKQDFVRKDEVFFVGILGRQAEAFAANQVADFLVVRLGRQDVRGDAELVERAAHGLDAFFVIETIEQSLFFSFHNGFPFLHAALTA